MAGRTIQFPSKDKPLKDDVSELGGLVGRVLREQCGDEFFALVEKARNAAIEGRQLDDHAEQPLGKVLDGLDPVAAARLVRGFSSYFQIVNLAERVHRIRRRREYLSSPQEPQPESIEWAMRELKKNGVSEESLRASLQDLVIEPVFTAHPTEATRRSLLEKQQHIARQLIRNLDSTITVPERRAIMLQIRGEITAAWQTEEHPSDRVTVSDERDNVLFFLTQILYRVASPYYENLQQSFSDVFPNSEPLAPASVLRFSSWVGGDMDGNPNVTARTIEESLERHRKAIVRRYYDDVMELSWRLSQSASRVAMDADIVERIMFYREILGDRLSNVHPRHETMFYRRFLRLIAGRLQATLDGHAAGYTGPNEFQSDIQLVANSLSTNKGEHAGLFLVNRLLGKIRTFGFHLATLDVRQDSLVYREAIGAGLGIDNWLEKSAAERTSLVSLALEQNTPAADVDSKALNDSIDVFSTIRTCRKKYGRKAIGPCVISMAQDADDVLSVLLLAQWAGFKQEPNSHIDLDVAPLFETVDDLRAGPDVMHRLLSHPVYSPHLDERDRRQMIMIGYSDSNKDGGLVAARWALQQGQRALVNVLAQHNTKVVFFHGRGGSISRGGGKLHQGILAAPHGSVQGRLRVTEQGEIINAKYGLRGIAMRTLEQSTSAVLLATLGPGREEFPQAWYEVMDDIAKASRDAYRELVYDDDNFTRYFRASTPIDVIEKMRIGSRPASRREGAGVKDLRAIPWVFSWTQSRQIITGWYGVGSGFKAAVEQHGEALIKEMVGASTFLQTLLDDVEMVLAKTDMSIARHYAKLADDDVYYIFEKIEAEFALTCDMIYLLKGTQTLLEHDATLKRAIMLRNPYVDPMSFIQVDLLKRWRIGGREDEQLLKALFSTVNGIAHGLQNTG